MNEEKVGAILLELGREISANQEKEAEAVKGYTEQLGMILKVLDEIAEGELRTYLEKLAAATEEKISDELNHQQSLLGEYVEITGIKIAEE